MNISIYGPANCVIGYGHCCFNIMKALHNLGVNVTYFPIGNPSLTTNDYHLLQQWINNQDNFDGKSPALTVWHEGQLGVRVAGTKSYGLSFFELDTLNTRRRNHLNSLDHIISPSAWAKDVMLNNDIIKPISVIPMGIDTTIFYKNNYVKPEGNPFVFFALGKLEVRKSHDILQQIFNDAFIEKDNVELWMMADNPFLDQEEIHEWENYYISSKLGSKIKFIHYTKSDQELNNIMNKVDCGLNLSRAEGWDLSATQLLAIGKPLIITNYSGHTQYCNSENSYLVDITETEEAYDGKWFGGNSDNHGNWAKIGPPQIDQIISHMRDAYKKGPTINHAGIETAKKLSWENCAKKMIEVIHGENNG